MSRGTLILINKHTTIAQCTIKDGVEEWYLGKIYETPINDGVCVIYTYKYKKWYLDGKYHRENGPAIEEIHEDENWLFNNNGVYRPDATPVEVTNGTRKWYKNGELHREDGPAEEWASGKKDWWFNGKRHREDGPAIEYIDEEKEWWLNGERHRTDGPAIIYKNKLERWEDDVKMWTYSLV